MLVRRLLAIPHVALVLVILSALWTLIRSGPLAGSGAALLATVILQVYLPGWLISRILGRARGSHPITQWAWILASGLGLTISIGSIARLLGIPVPVYLIFLHIIMTGLALFPPAKSPETIHVWKFTRTAFSSYLLLAICVAIVVWVSFQSRYRFWGFEDQPIFIGQIEWMASKPYEQPPGGLPLLSRQISVASNQRGDTRLASDGWTYNHAAWVWTSEVPAAQLIWYDITALFIWAGPLIAFAMAYELTGRESAGAWTSAALVIAGLFTVDGLVYTPNYEAFGRLSVFQVNTLRFFTLTIMLPLSLTIGLSYLRASRKRDLIVVTLAGSALAFLHPFGITLFAAVMVGTALITLGELYLPRKKKSGTNQQSYPIQSRRSQARYLFYLVALLGILLVIPFVQRLDRSGLGAADSLIPNSDAESSVSESQASSIPEGFISFRGIPAVGSTYIREPRAVFYHPVIAVAAFLGILTGFAWRRHLAARYMVTGTGLMLLIAFLPGLTAFVNRFMSTLGLYTTTFLLPVALIIGLFLEYLVSIVKLRIPKWANMGFVLLAIGWMLITLLEPFPIPMSARDELNGFNTVQSVRRVQSYQMELIERLREILPKGPLYIVTTPYTISNLLTEELTGVFITGGRASRNAAYVPDARIYTALNPVAPWWDAEDVSFLQKYGVTHLILEADDTRLPQAMISPERFTLLDRIHGYFIFEVNSALSPTTIELLYSRMNTLYTQISEPRWSKLGFAPERPGDTRWNPLVSDWEALAVNTQTQLGLAFTLLMAGRDTEAVALWEELRAEVSSVPLFAQSASHARYAAAPDPSALQPLLDDLYGTNHVSQIMAARSLFDAQFFYLLTDEQLAQITSVPTAHPQIWHQLAVLDRPDQVRRRAGLLMNTGMWNAAATELQSITPVLLAPQDVMTISAANLLEGDKENALEILNQASDPDWVAPRAEIHPDRWEKNVAAAWESQLRGEASSPSPESLWNAFYSNRLYVLAPQIERSRDERTLSVSAWFGGPKPFADPYVFRTWRFQIINPSTGETYALEDQPATNSADSLIGATSVLKLPDDLPELTPGHMVITPRYDDRIYAQPLVIPLVLNRPDAAKVKAEAMPVNIQFGNAITLVSAHLQMNSTELHLHLYWQTAQELTEDYQIFLHILDSAGNRVAQRDSAPLNNLYPTSQWRLNTLIDDDHIISLTQPLLPGEYTIHTGLYRLPDGTRLTVSPSDRAQDNSLEIMSFTVKR